MSIVFYNNIQYKLSFYLVDPWGSTSHPLSPLLARSLFLTIISHLPRLSGPGIPQGPPLPAPPAASPLRTTPSRPTKSNGVGEGPPPFPRAWRSILREIEAASLSDSITSGELRVSNVNVADAAMSSSVNFESKL